MVDVYSCLDVETTWGTKIPWACCVPNRDQSQDLDANTICRYVGTSCSIHIHTLECYVHTYVSYARWKTESIIQFNASSFTCRHLQQERRSGYSVFRHINCKPANVDHGFQGFPCLVSVFGSPALPAWQFWVRLRTQKYLLSTITPLSIRGLSKQAKIEHQTQPTFHVY